VLNKATNIVETFILPINQRVYIIDDIDCMSDIVKKREYKSNLDEGGNETRVPVMQGSEKLMKMKAKLRDLENKFSAMDKKGEWSNELYEEKLVLGEQIGKLEEDAEQAANNPDKITLDALLNTFDGSYEVPGRILCITTNYVNIIDDALIRPGRIDLNIVFKLCNRPVICDLFNSFYDRKTLVSQFEAAKIKEYKLSPADVNQIMFKHLLTPENAIREMCELSNKRKPRSTGSTTTTGVPKKTKAKKETKVEIPKDESDSE
jgi:hypothetical protein